MYDEQFCKKHNQHFADFLPRCPICRGEEMAGPVIRLINPGADVPFENKFEIMDDDFSLFD